MLQTKTNKERMFRKQRMSRLCLPKNLKRVNIVLRDDDACVIAKVTSCYIVEASVKLWSDRTIYNIYFEWPYDKISYRDIKKVSWCHVEFYHMIGIMLVRYWKHVVIYTSNYLEFFLQPTIETQENRYIVHTSLRPIGVIYLFTVELKLNRW